MIARLRQKAQAVPGVQLFLQPAQDIDVGGRLARTLYQYTLQDADAARAVRLGAEGAASSCRRCRCCATSPPTSRSPARTATLTIDRDAAARFGIQPQVIDDTLYDAFGQRQITQYFTQLNSYHLILEVPPELEGDLDDAATSCMCARRTAQAVPLSTFVQVDTKPVAPLSISHQSQFPAVTISFNLAPGVALGEAVTRSTGDRATAARAAVAAGQLPGHRAGVPVLAVEPSPT